MNDVSFLIKQWEELFKDHRVALGRNITLAASFPIVLGAGFAFATANIKDSFLSPFSSIVPFFPIVIILWWTTLFGFIAVNNVKRYRILRTIELEIQQRDATRASWPISYLMSEDTTRGLVKLVTKVNMAILGIIVLCIYLTAIYFAMQTLFTQGISKTMILSTGIIILIVTTTLTVAWFVRVKFYLSDKSRQTILDMVSEEKQSKISLNQTINVEEDKSQSNTS